MPTQKSSPKESRGSTRANRSKRAGRRKSSRSAGSAPGADRSATTDSTRSFADGLASLAEQFANRVISPLGIVMLTRERIQQTLDEAAERGRVTRTDANELAAELVRCGRQQTDELLGDIDRLLGAGREQLSSAGRLARVPDSMERLMPRTWRGSESPSFPIPDYDDLLAREVEERLKDLTPAELRKVREYELRHANRKSVLSAIERSLG